MKTTDLFLTSGNWRRRRRKREEVEICVDAREGQEYEKNATV